MNLVARVIGIILRPDFEWLAIEREPGGVKNLILGYVAILALIPAVCGFIGGSLVGVTVSAGTFRTPMVTGAINAVLGYILTFVIVYLVALAIDLLAPVFKAQRHFASAFKLSVYSFTPAWLAGIFLLIPGLRFLTILGLYGLYLLWTGLPPLMRTPQNRAFLYAAAVVICALVITIILAVVQGSVSSLVRFG